MNKSMILLALVALGGFKVTLGNTDKEVDHSSTYDSEDSIDRYERLVDQELEIVREGMEKTGSHLFSAKGAKDLALAYCVAMGMTLMHELGHSVVGKVLFASPIDITIGAHASHNNLGSGGIALASFNPLIGNARYYYNIDDHDPVLATLKNAVVFAAGPIAGALSSIGVYALMRKYDDLYIAKGMTLLILYANTLGMNGVSGTWTPGTDSNHIMQYVRLWIELRNKPKELILPLLWQA